MTDSTTGTVKPVSHYISTPAIEALVEQAGAHLESVSPTQKCLMSAVLADHLASGNEYYSIIDSLHYTDPHHVLEGEIGQCLGSHCHRRFQRCARGFAASAGGADC